METKVNIRISNRHVHLNKETYYKLFDKDMTVKNYLNQVGEFATNETLTIRNGDKVIENVRVLGPSRSYNQIEVSRLDARKLGLNPPVRRSGDLFDSLTITLETEKGSVTTNGLIISNRHIHMNKSDALKYGVKDRDIVGIKIDTDKGGIAKCEVKVTDNGYFEAHFDTDCANSFGINDNYEGIMVKYE